MGMNKWNLWFHHQQLCSKRHFPLQIFCSVTTRTHTPGVISRGNAWERRSHCWKAAGTHGNSVPVVKMFKNAQNSSRVEKK